MEIGLPVCDDNESVIPQLGIDQLVKRFFGPHGIFPFSRCILTTDLFFADPSASETWR
jgi:hypothetical protein